MATIEAHGIRVEVPRGWEARIFRRAVTPPETSHPVLHVASFVLPSDAGDYGGGILARMPAPGVFLAMVEFGADDAHSPLFASAGPPRSLAAVDFARSTVPRAAYGLVGAQRFFTAAGRPFSLLAVVNGEARLVSSTAALSDVLASISVSAA